MTAPVNLENLREMTGGDVALERELFGVYLETAEKNLAILRESLASQDNETWRSCVHAWKGTSLNLGAADLAKLCAEAQTSHTASAPQKQQLLAALETAYADVKRYLQAVMQGA